MNDKYNTQQKLEEFLNLPKGWRYGDGLPIPRFIYSMARMINTYALSLGYVTEVFPTVEPGIVVVAYVDNKALDFEIAENILSYKLTIDDNIDPEEQYELSTLVDAFELLEKEIKSDS